MTLHNVNVLMSLNLTPKSDKFYVCFSTKEETRTRKTGSRTARTPALSVPRAPSVSAKTTRGPLRTNIGHSAPTGVAQRERFHFHLESCQAHRGTGHAARGLDVLSVAGRGRAGSRGRGRGAAKARPAPPRQLWTATPDTCEHVAWRSTRFLGTKTRALFSPLVQRRERERKGRD